MALSFERLERMLRLLMGWGNSCFLGGLEVRPSLSGEGARDVFLDDTIICGFLGSSIMYSISVLTLLRAVNNFGHCPDADGNGRGETHKLCVIWKR